MVRPFQPNHASQPVRWNRRASLVIAMVALCTGCFARLDPIDLLIEGGIVVDGRDRPARVANVGVIGDRITYIGVEQPAATSRLDASGLIVAPGFIDAHSHLVQRLDEDPSVAELSLFQGITTIVGGADGELDPIEIDRLHDFFDKHELAINIAFLVGHDATRQALPSAGDEKARQLLLERIREGLQLGALGVVRSANGRATAAGGRSEEVELTRMAQAVGAFYVVGMANSISVRFPWEGDRSSQHDVTGHAIHPHPADAAQFSRVMSRYVAQLQLITMPAAIHQMSLATADRIGLVARGRVSRGRIADLLVLDPAMVRDRATPREPSKRAEGVRHLLVNGVLVVRDGQRTDARPGRILTRKQHAGR